MSHEAKGHEMEDAVRVGEGDIADGRSAGGLKVRLFFLAPSSSSSSFSLTSGRDCLVLVLVFVFRKIREMEWEGIEDMALDDLVTDEQQVDEDGDSAIGDLGSAK